MALRLKFVASPLPEDSASFLPVFQVHQGSFLPLPWGPHTGSRAAKWGAVGLAHGVLGVHKASWGDLWVRFSPQLMSRLPDGTQKAVSRNHFLYCPPGILNAALPMSSLSAATELLIQ